MKLSVAMAENMGKAERAATVADTLTKAKKYEAEASAAIIALGGDEAKSRQAAAESSATYAKALQNQADADTRVATTLRTSIEALEARAKAEGRLDDATKKKLETLRQDLAGKEADAEKTRQQADAARVHATALDIQAKSYGDNSSRVKEYRTALADAQVHLDAVIRAFGRDRATMEDVKVATESLSKAQGLLNDALADSVKAIKSKADLQVSALGIEASTLRAAKESAATNQQLAESEGNLVLALQYVIEQKRIDIQLSELATRQKRLEAETILKLADADREAALANGTFNGTKRDEIEARLNNAKAKQIEADASAEATRRLQAELELIQRRGVVARQSSAQVVAGINSETAAREASIAAQEKQIALTAKEWELKRQVLNTAGKEVNSESPTWLSIFNQAKSGGLDEAQARSVANSFTDSNGNFDQVNRSAAQNKFDPQGYGNVGYAVNMAIGDQLRRAGQGGIGGASPAVAPAAPVAGSSYVVNVNLAGGGSSSIKVASQADADALANLLKQLQDSAGRAGP